MSRTTTNRVKKFINKHFVPLFIGVGLFLFVLGSMLRYNYVNKPATIDSDRIRLNIESYFSQTTSLCEQWLESRNDEQFISNLWKIETPENWEQRRVSLYLYKQDSMLLWANHLYSDDFDPLPLPVTDSIIQWGDDKMLIRKFAKGSKSAIVVINLYDPNFGVNVELFDSDKLELVSSKEREETISMGNNFYIQPHIQQSAPISMSIVAWLGLLLIVTAIKRIFRSHTHSRNAFTVNFLFLFLLLSIGCAFTVANLQTGSNGLFNTMIFMVNDVQLSLGKLLINFTLLLLYSIYLYSIRYKLRYRYRHLNKWSQRFLLLAVLIFVDFIVVFFHYAMVNVIYHSSVNVELYKFTLIDINTAVFYFIGALFVASRIMMNHVVRLVFGRFSSVTMVVISVMILTLMILPIEVAIGNTGYILLIFHIAFLLLSFINAPILWRYIYALIISVFSVYIMLFATIESNVADAKNAKIYAQKLAYESRLTDESQAIYQKLTYYKIFNNKIEVKDNNSVDLQQLTRIIELGVDTTVSSGGYLHYLFHAENGQIVVVSRHELTMLDYMAFFSYIFIVLYVIVNILLGFASYKYKNVLRSSRFVMRIRLVVIGIVMFTMGLVVVVIIINTFENYDVTSRKIVNNETQTLLHSFEQYAANSSVDDELLLRDWFINNGEVIGKDVIIYEPNGKYIASSMRTKAYDMMNSSAYSALFWNGAPLYNRLIHYKNRMYNSAYLPIFIDDKLLGYINLIQLDRVNSIATDPRYDILVSIFNILIVVVLVALVLSMILYRAITLPLSKLHSGMADISALRKIEESDSNDEVAILIRQYNLMIDYLEQSYEALARSEREVAWREMARQVAHEIKNPLTPMRLKIQILQRAKQRGDENLDTRIDNTLDVLLEQIDLLAKIATEFSDFARMSDNKIERVSVAKLFDTVGDLYANNNDVTFVVQPVDERLELKIDYSQILRVLINLCQNANQATVDVNNPRIVLSALREENDVVIRVSDNGSGVSPEANKHIFEPNFTTKSSGSGIGLAMSRQIILNSGGTITFESEPGVETSFIIRLPLFNDGV